jgi:hypothetical protein
MEREVSSFGGAAGRIFWGAVSVHSLLTGTALGFVLFLGNSILIYAGAHLLVTLFTQVIFALALARFVLNGQFGEWEGSIFSDVGGSWSSVCLVAARYLVLTMIWLLPLMLFGLRIEQATLSLALFAGKSAVLFSIYTVASAMTPPLLLVVSVSANDFAELFSREHWGRLFEGRLQDLACIYAVYTGGVALAALLCLPPIVMSFQPSPTLGVLVLGLSACFLIGLGLNLLGRLCGFFALGDSIEPADCLPQPAVPPQSELDPDGGGPTTTQLPEPGLAHRSSEQAPDQDSNAVPGFVAHPLPGGPAPAQRSQATRSPGETSAAEPPAAQPATAPKPALLDASLRVDSIVERFGRDPAGALRALEELRESFAPHPQVLAALCLCRHRNGETAEAVRLAQAVLPLCFDRGHVQLAAQLYKQLRHEVDQLGLNREQILTLAEALLKKGDLVGAGAAFSTAIARDPGENRAVKGLLQVAELYIGQRDRPDAALKVYDYLLKHCPESPLAGYAREGRARCQKRPTEPVG